MKQTEQIHATVHAILRAQGMSELNCPKIDRQYSTTAFGRGCIKMFKSRFCGQSQNENLGPA
ncbi:UNVERIFIED_ORG: hypothetical protein EDF86_1574 [Pseudomonas psychrophila]